MTQEIKVGDWISYPVSGLESQGKVLSIDEDGYGVQLKDNPTGTAFVPFGDRVKKISPPEGEE